MEIMPQSSHINHKFLILVIRVTNVSFAMKSFSQKVVGSDVSHEENSPTSKILVSFLFFNIANLLQITL